MKGNSLESRSQSESCFVLRMSASCIPSTFINVVGIRHYVGVMSLIKQLCINGLLLREGMRINSASRK